MMIMMMMSPLLLSYQLHRYVIDTNQVSVASSTLSTAIGGEEEEEEEEEEGF